MISAGLNPIVLSVVSESVRRGEDALLGENTRLHNELVYAVSGAARRGDDVRLSEDARLRNGLVPVKVRRVGNAGE